MCPSNDKRQNRKPRETQTRNTTTVQCNHFRQHTSNELFLCQGSFKQILLHDCVLSVSCCSFSRVQTMSDKHEGRYTFVNEQGIFIACCLSNLGNLITGMLHEYFVNENFRLVVKKGEIDIEIYVTRILLTRYCFFRCNRHVRVCLVFCCRNSCPLCVANCNQLHQSNTLL